MPSLIQNESHPQPSNAKEWFCIRTQPKHEALTAGFLQQFHAVEVFNPRIQVRRRGRGRMVWVMESLFGCYIFARFDLRDSLEKIRFTPGVSSLINFGGKTPVIPTEEIECLRASFGENPQITPRNAFQEGDQITLSSGPFEGMSATVVRMMSASQRVQLLMDFLGQSISIDVSLDLVASV
jgi:transcriptional antiterminator RfaH